ncbi:hypothetical protein R1sor_023185 [Riccia sorocarpa]|uniref:Uncharacterized protein n=1 Tax=Riccia sorocarpa TaxID=122646 RepID=A0ABD3GR44_9MARC
MSTWPRWACIVTSPFLDEIESDDNRAQRYVQHGGLHLIYRVIRVNHGHRIHHSASALATASATPVALLVRFLSICRTESFTASSALRNLILRVLNPPRSGLYLESSLLEGRRTSITSMGRGSGLLRNDITKLLLLTLVVAGAVHKTADAATPKVSSPPPPPPDSNSTSTSDASAFTKYKEASINQVGKYDIVWTDLNPESGKSKGVCYVTGYYDDTILTTPTSVQLCFSDLRSTIVSGYVSGFGIYFSDTFYSNTDDQSCVVNCLEQAPGGSSAAIPSVPLSILPWALSILIVLALNYH